MSLITDNYTYKTLDSEINKTIAFCPVSLSEDLDKIHKWMNQDYVISFWKLGFDKDKIQQHLEKALADKHQTLYIGFIDDVPMSYWESYWTIDDVISGCYPAKKYDQGIHLLIGDRNFLGKGYALPLLRAMTFFKFKNSPTQKVIAEPDIRNKKMIYIFEKCGFVFQKEILLPDKSAALMFCKRQHFMEKWK
ncbi:GNAT family N-acetyltransferase [Rivularia sp. UHCC 0363]|uniref:GNAT family N-acetyltransferase n=1 Tax=Rivularia sp. UHCC 0363 TaxID=3110244 RepID=UPI002B20BEF1|nr:GNAT family N-acetyltransferase [Rivularia sp. UHCC 0363]MEA5598164.1 GNAT family N-acetyltransferase [Rivularia sp. UHCC 0363]